MVDLFGVRFQGHYQDDLREGKGIEVLLDGSAFIGNWTKGMKNGLGYTITPTTVLKTEQKMTKQ